MMNDKDYDERDNYIPDFVKRGPKMFNAEEARRLQTEALGMDGAYLKNETQSILNDIRDAALKGLQTITTTISTDFVVMRRLKELGFKVENVNERTGDFMRISW
jgi:hypothetical protein